MHLARQGLLSRAESATASVFIMLNIVRAYAASQLERYGEAPAARTTLKEQALRLSEAVQRELIGADEDSWRDLVWRRSATFTSALEVCRSEGDLDTGTDILWNISPAFYGGPLSWARLWIEEALEEGGGSDLRRGKLLCMAALFGMMTGARGPAAELALQGLSLLEAERYPEERDQAFELLRFFVRAPELADVVSDADARVEALRAKGETIRLGRALRSRGMRRMAAGRIDEAEADLDEGLSIVPRRAMTARRALLHGLAAVKIRKGELQAAKQLLLSGLEGQMLGTPVMNVAQMYNLLGLVSELLGERHAAAEAYERALRTALVIGTTTPLRAAFRGAASLAAAYGRSEEAARLAGAAAKAELTDAIYDLVPEARRDDLEPALRRKLGRAGYEAAFRQGMELSLERATAEALEELEPYIRGEVRMPASA
jgi:tetratricopeptide (TPR) repeat protein